MEASNFALSLAAIAAVSLLVSCEGSDTRMRPAVPSDLTTTTGAPSPGRTPASADPAAPSSPTIDDTTALASPASSAAHSDPSGAPLGADETAPAEPRGNRHAAASFTDPEIAAVIDAAGRAERRLARDALKRATSPRVRQLAQWVLSDHEAAKLEKVERSVSLLPLESATSADVVSNGARTAEGLASSSDQDFDRLYVEALAGEERRLVRILDGELIPQAQNSELRTLLQEVRTSTSSRLRMAEDLKSAGPR